MPLDNDHRYPPLRLGRREPYILNLCKGKRVLDLGFMDVGLTQEKAQVGSLLHQMIHQVAAVHVGIDLDSSLRHLLPPDSDRYKLFFGNVEDPATFAQVGEMRFDVVVAAELIEHVNNPGLFLSAVRTVMTPATTLLLTVPNALRFQNLVYAHQGLEKVNPDHNYWFSPATIQTLLNKNGFHVNALAGYIFGPERPEHLGPHGLACPGLIVEGSIVQGGERPRRWPGQCAAPQPQPQPQAQTVSQPQPQPQPQPVGAPV
jgi:2-polyprenyl-3-methyl-5-hydroxy-6-metoxy-1,4-benzoquinol methylase